MNAFKIFLKNLIENTFYFLKHKITYYLLFCLGLSCVILIIYFNFIRERLPKNIPFILSEYSFYFLLFICGLYAYT